jgi:hypothetical protein
MAPRIVSAWLESSTTSPCSTSRSTCSFNDSHGLVYSTNSPPKENQPAPFGNGLIMMGKRYHSQATPLPASMRQAATAHSVATK